MLLSQRKEFNLPDNVAYLNCATMAPLSKKADALARSVLDLRAMPYKITMHHWFEAAELVKKKFARLINVQNHERIALIPSVSYGIASLAKNIVLKPGNEIVVAAQQYPSNYYSWFKLAKKHNAKLKAVEPPTDAINRGKGWNQNFLNAITENTKIVALGNVHWTDGTLFNLEVIGQKAKACGALLIIDGSQSIGALPFNVEKIQPDAVVSVGYKWLLGPYSLGLAYFGPHFDEGTPLEESWVNRKDSENFQGLVDYTPYYRPLAGRYSMGESSNIHLMPVINGALEQLLNWGVEHIQAYCKNLVAKHIDELRTLGCIIENDAYRAQHLFGIRFKKKIDLKKLEKKFLEENIYVSLRGDAVRISVNIYNEDNDLHRLVKAIKEIVKEDS